MKKSLIIISLVITVTIALAAIDVPPEIQQPGTQPQEVSNLESPNKCDNCHGGYNELVEPAFNWRGSMMANAGRDPIFWATLAVAEQDFDGSGDLCIRCHSTSGWLAGRSTPTDGSALAAGDADGVECDFCHKMTNPDDFEHLGVMNPPFIANDGTQGFYGSGMASIWGGADKLGPYFDAQARHQFMQSNFHRSQDFCGSCHDVSNSAVGDLSSNNGTQLTADSVNADGFLGSPVDGKAAFNNPPYMYGIVERTFSEFKSGSLSTTPVSEYYTLPEELQTGALKVAYESSLVAGMGGDYADGIQRNFTCQTCHLRPVDGPGCNKKGVPSRLDLPLHDMTGGNYWMPDAVKYLDPLGKLRLGGGLTTIQIAALDAGAVRAKKQLSEAAILSVNGNSARIVNLTGHKLISGYPEGRRMWLNIIWKDNENNVVREDGTYGLIDTINPTTGFTIQVNSILDLYDPNTKIYEAHYGMTKEWAQQLISLGYDPGLALSYDRYSGNIEHTLGDLAAQAPGSDHETFHFVLNNTVVKDNRIPPYGFAYNEARIRNALPVPADQYGNPGTGGTYNYYDDFSLNPPADATYAEIKLMYQPTSWEYIQFLVLANTGSNPFLIDEGVNLLEAWLNTGMAEPYVMASTTWGEAPTPPIPSMFAQSLTTWIAGNRGVITETNVFTSNDNVIIKAVVVDESGISLSGVQVFMNITDESGSLITTLQGFSDNNGIAELQWKIPRRQATGNYTATVANIIKNSYEFDSSSGVTEVLFVIQ